MNTVVVSLELLDAWPRMVGVRVWPMGETDRTRAPGAGKSATQLLVAMIMDEEGELPRKEAR